MSNNHSMRYQLIAAVGCYLEPWKVRVICLRQMATKPYDWIIRANRRIINFPLTDSFFIIRAAKNGKKRRSHFAVKQDDLRNHRLWVLQIYSSLRLMDISSASTVITKSITTLLLCLPPTASRVDLQSVWDARKSLPVFCITQPSERRWWLWGMLCGCCKRRFCIVGRRWLSEPQVKGHWSGKCVTRWVGICRWRFQLEPMLIWLNGAVGGASSRCGAFTVEATMSLADDNVQFHCPAARVAFVLQLTVSIWFQVFSLPITHV